MSEMRICDFEVGVHLGYFEQERQNKQLVRFQLTLKFLNTVLAETTDQLSDAVDYQELTNILKTISVQKHFFLLEHLCRQNLDSLCGFLRQRNFKGEVILEVLKVQTPIENLKSGVAWTCQQRLY